MTTNGNSIDRQIATVIAQLQTASTEIALLRKEVAVQGKALAAMQASMTSHMDSRPCEAHSLQLARLERQFAHLDDAPARLRSLENAMGKRGFLAAVIGAVGTAMVLALKYVLTAGQGGHH
jgi:hypothetical protein